MAPTEEARHPLPPVAGGGLLAWLTHLEVSLHGPQSGDQRADPAALIHAAFREVGRSGRVYDREAILAHLAQPGRSHTVRADDFAVSQFGTDTALLTYRSAHMDEGGRLTDHTHRTSLWVREPEGWQLRFHQGTAAATVW